jgi:hypothetical protein
MSLQLPTSKVLNFAVYFNLPQIYRNLFLHTENNNTRIISGAKVTLNTILIYREMALITSTTGYVDLMIEFR